MLRIINELSLSDSYQRAVEQRNTAIETSTIIDSDATVFNEEEHRTLMKERRRKHARLRVSSAEQSVSDETEPPSQKQKNVFP